MIQTAPHPAMFSDNIIERIRSLVDQLFMSRWGVGPDTQDYFTILDQFAGTGRIHQLDRVVNNLRPYKTIGVEIEPEWASHDPRTIVGNALELPFADNSIDCGCTSPSYGNRMADSHHAKDLCGNCQGVGTEPDGLTVCKRCKGSKLSVRRTYTHMLGRPLSPWNSGSMQWGVAYRQFHFSAWNELYRVLKPGAPFILNVSDHIRKGERVPVCKFHITALLDIGFELLRAEPIQTPRMKYGANHESRVDHEMLIVFTK